MEIPRPSVRLVTFSRDRESQRRLGVLEELMKRTNEPPHGIAVVHAGLKEEAETLRWLEKACDQRDSG